MSDTNDVNVCVSGYFDPIHTGHLEYLVNSRKLLRGNGKLVVIVNNDKQAILKKGREFMPFAERVLIVKAIRFVDEVVPSIDEGRNVCETLRKAHIEHNIHVFANGGDQNNDTIPEVAVCEDLGIQLVDGLGNKIQSSSWLTGIKAKK